MPRRDLFQLATAAERKRALTVFRGTPLGKAIQKYDMLMSQAGKGAKVIQTALHSLRRQTTRSIIQKIVAQRNGREVERYAREPSKNSLLTMLFKALGPIGDVFKSLMFPAGQAVRVGIARQLEAAQRLLNSFGYTTIQPPAVSGGSRQTQEQVAEFLQKNGWKVEPPEGADKPPGPGAADEGGKPPSEPPAPPSAGDDDDEDRPRRGRRRLVGRMHRVYSSNVYAIGYDPDPGGAKIGTLKVQFYAYTPGIGKHNEAGPIYHYFNVPRTVWKAFKQASSKGRFVWDKIRIRGTVSGHKYNWTLAGVTHAYVPRRASGEGDEEWYRKRSVAFEGRVIRSVLPEQMVSGPNRAGPNRGRPDEPNRGRPSGPNRGR